MSQTERPVIYIAVPCYNEEEVLPISSKALTGKLRALISAGEISEKSRVAFIDDGSKDATWQIISDYCEKDELICGIKLSRNRGHQNALLAGLMTLREHADAVISIDADLQDDVDAFDGMIAKYKEGCEIVFGVRGARETDSFLKRTTAQSYYKLLKMLGADIIYNHADYRLMSRCALDAMSEYGEVNLFLRGIVPMLGYKYDCVYYDRAERAAGKSKYSPGKMFALAWEGVTSISTRPLRFITVLGLFIFLCSIAMLIYFVVRYFTGHTVLGWASLAVSIWGIGGLLMLAIGIIGEYVGKIYL